MIKKIQENIYTIWKKTKQHIYSLVSGQFKTERSELIINNRDWYDQHSWFERKWFKHKLKRLIMRNVYNFIDKVGDILFDKTHETYYSNFIIHNDTYRLRIFELPLILKIKANEDIMGVLAWINSELTNLFGFIVVNEQTTKILNKEDEIRIKKELEIKFSKFTATGKIKFKTVKYNKPDYKINRLVPLTIDINDVPLGYSTLNTQMLDFGVIETKNRKKLINHLEEYQIFIDFDKIVKKVLYEGPEGIPIDKINRLLNSNPN